MLVGFCVRVCERIAELYCVRIDGGIILVTHVRGAVVCCRDFIRGAEIISHTELTVDSYDLIIF